MEDFDKRTASGEGGEVKLSDRPLKSDRLAKIENYWYHYKWHTIGALVLILAILISTLQMCSKESGDISVFQVGGDKLGAPSQSQIRDSIVEDVLKDEDRQVSFISHYIVSVDVLEEMDDAAFLANSSFENANAFKMELATSEAYICLFSRDVYNLSLTYYPLERDKESGALYSQLYRPLSDFTSGLTDTYDDYAVYLHKTPLADLPGFKGLPLDTLICFRRLSYMASVVGKDKAEEVYARHEDVFRAMINYQED